MFLRYPGIGLAIGLLVGAVSAYLMSPGYETSDSVIGTGLLGAAAGWVIGTCVAVVSLVLRGLRAHRTGQGEERNTAEGDSQG